MLTPRPSPKAVGPETPRSGAPMVLDAVDDLAAPLQRLARSRGQSPEAVAIDLLRQALEREDRRKQAEAALTALTTRQRQVVRLTADGRTNREIARELWLSPETIKTHLRRALEHFGVRSKAELRLLLSDLVDPSAGGAAD